MIWREDIRDLRQKPTTRWLKLCLPIIIGIIGIKRGDIEVVIREQKEYSEMQCYAFQWEMGARTSLESIELFRTLPRHNHKPRRISSGFYAVHQHKVLPNCEDEGNSYITIDNFCNK